MERNSVRPFRTPSPPRLSIKNKQSMTIRYIWQNSIPDTWKKIIEKKGISMIHIEKNDRRTLEFLKETQQYINFIRKPSEMIGDSKFLDILPQSSSRGSFLNESPKNQLIGSLSTDRFRNYEGSPLPFITRDPNRQDVIKFWKKKNFKNKLKRKVKKDEKGVNLKVHVSPCAKERI